MTTQTEALNMALEALEWSTSCMSFDDFDDMPKALAELNKVHQAITAIKEALAQPEQDKERCVGCEACIDTACGRDECPKGWPKAAQPEQEPVAHTAIFHCPNCEYPHRQVTHITGVAQPPWSPQRTWVGLTEEDMDWLHANTPCIEGNYGYRFIKAIEAKLKEKNT